MLRPLWKARAQLHYCFAATFSPRIREDVRCFQTGICTHFQPAIAPHIPLYVCWLVCARLVVVRYYISAFFFFSFLRAHNNSPSPTPQLPCLAKQERKKRALKISGWVFWGFGMVRLVWSSSLSLSLSLFSLFILPLYPHLSSSTLHSPFPFPSHFFFPQLTAELSFTPASFFFLPPPPHPFFVSSSPSL